MRLWCLHPRYLDAKGLVALWREGLLAKAVLKKQTKGYKNHPQLLRFKETKNPVQAIDQYLWAVHEESEKRGYNFDSTKLGRKIKANKIKVTSGQLRYEFEHLSRKLKLRSPLQYRMNKKTKSIRPHPLFKVIKGSIALWEKISSH